MHPYATDSKERELVPFFLAIFSVLFAWLLHSGLEVAPIIMPWWIDAPSVIGFYWIFKKIFDKHLWKWSFLRKVRLVKIPLLNGIWNGYITTSFDKHAEKQDATIKIRQSWLRISISLETQNSKSHSLTTTLLTENQNAVVLCYEYLNEPIPIAKNTMQTHRGTARLTIKADGQALEGEYYSGRGRQNVGILSFKRQ